METRGAGSAEAIELRTPAGPRHFRIDRAAHRPAGHVREQTTYGEPVVVPYGREDGALVALTILGRNAGAHPTWAPPRTRGGSDG